MPYLTILIDDSASEQIADQYEEPEVKAALDALAAASRPRGRGHSRRADRHEAQTTRLDIAKGLILKDKARLIRELEKQHKVRLYRVSNTARLLAEVDRPADLDRRVEKMRAIEADGTQIAAGRRRPPGPDRAARGAPPSAIVLFTDGQTTEGESLSKAAELAARRACRSSRSAWAAPSRPATSSSPSSWSTTSSSSTTPSASRPSCSARGFEGEKVKVRLKEREPGSDDPKSDRVLETDERRCPRERPARARRAGLSAQDHRRATFIMEVDPRPRELQTDNNRIERVITVRKEKLKVLYVDSEPRYEFRYLKNYLDRDESIDLNIVLLSSDPEYSEQDRSALPTFPAAKDDLFAYDVVLFGDADTSFLSQSQMQNLVEFVTEKGGGVLFIAGELFNPLSLSRHPARTPAPDRAGRRAQPDGRRHGRRRRSAPS